MSKLHGSAAAVKKPNNSRSLVDDVDFEPEFYQLKDLFPDIADGIILDVLELAQNDVSKATHHLLEGPSNDEEEEVSAVDENSLDYKLSCLIEIFPSIEPLTIKQALLNHQSDVEDTMTYLLSYDALQDAEEQNRLEAEESRRKQHESNKKMQLESDIEDLVDITELSKKEVKNYLHKNNENVVKTLIDIVLHYHSDEEQRLKEKLMLNQMHKLSTSDIPIGGRVQASYSIPLTEKKITKKHKQNYLYNDSNPEVQELAEFVFNDPILVEISWEFFKKIIIFFNGDTSRVIGLAIYILEKGGANETFIATSGLYQESTAEQSIQRQGKPLDYSRLINDHYSQRSNFYYNEAKLSKKPIMIQQEEKLNPNKNPYLNPAKAANLPDVEIDLKKYQIALQRFQLLKAKETSILDLHRFHVKVAKITVEKALDEWWEDELKARQENGNAYPGVKARHLSPFVIISGKGIHSEGGISKIKISIRSFLKNSSYIYTEETARFVVTGKRTG